jgi:hypothetical protein
LEKLETVVLDALIGLPTGDLPPPIRGGQNGVRHWAFSLPFSLLWVIVDGMIELSA